MATTNTSHSIYSDSEATLRRAYSKMYNGKSRHIGLRHDYIRQLIEDGTISIVYVKSNNNLVDPFTIRMELKPFFNRITNSGNPISNWFNLKSLKGNNKLLIHGL